MFKYTTIFAVIAGLVLAVAPAANAATITWGTPTTVASDSIVDTSGTLLEAFNFGDATAKTVSGVTFTGQNTGQANTYSDFTELQISSYHTHYDIPGKPATVTGDFADMMNHAAWAGESTGDETATISLVTTSGTQYLVQLFVSAYSGAYYEFQYQVIDTAVSAPNTDSYSLIGRFTADSGSQDILISCFNISNDAPVPGVILNGYQLRVVPEPATMSLLAIGGLGVLLKRRRRRA